MTDSNKSILLLIVTGVVFALAMTVMISVRLYGDDFHYYQFTTRDLEYFLTRHVQHYSLANGRVIVHLLVTVFLWGGTLLWSIVNSAMIAGIVYFGAKNTFGAVSAFIIGIGVMFLDPNITRQSVYWLTGSFNYVYPLFILIVFWYLVNQSIQIERYSGLLPFLGFVAGATVEQAGVMAFGMVLMTVLEIKILRQGKVSKILWITLFVTLLGILSILLSPAIQYRASMEDAPVQGFLSLLKYNITEQMSKFLFSKQMTPYHFASLLSAIWLMHKYLGRLTQKWRRIEYAMLMFGLVIALVWIVMGYTDGFRTLFNISYKAMVILSLIIFVGCFSVLLYTGCLIYHHRVIRNFTLPFIAVILAFGSQAMMLISPVYGPRNLLFAIVPLTLYSAAIVPKLILGVSSRCKIISAALGLFALVASLTVFVPTTRGYADNASVYDNNIKLVNQYKENNSSGILKQKVLPHEKYAWVMPYHTSYYDVYYKLYMGISEKTSIDWIG